MSAESPRNNLPADISSFIGRERAIAEVKRLIGTTRLLTLTGPGGCGKTRLALQVAGELTPEYEDGVWLTELAPLADASLVPQVVASAVGIREQPGQPLIDSLTTYLRPRSILLVLDNCEHLIEACAQLASSLLAACPDLRILATSRERLGLSGETVWTVPPLSLSAVQPWRDPTSAQKALQAYESSEAMRLFVARASAIAPAFSLTPENGGWVAEVCRHLDGMPLAIELAAARVKILSVEQIAKRLHDVFDLLTEGSRTALPRHRTLQATIDWSYNLLSGDEQTLLRRLSVFAGGWTLEAAEMVCARQGVEAGEILNVLTRLADKSMVGVNRSAGREIRYRMLETIREYAWERLLETGESAFIQQRHAETFLTLVRGEERTESKLFWPENMAVEQLELDLDNLRAALAWCALDPRGYEIGLSLASALAQFWQMRGYLSEAREYFEKLLSIVGDVSAATRAEALSLAGYLSIYAADIERGVTYLEESLALYRDLGDKSGIAWQLVWLGWASVARGDLSQAKILARQAYQMQKELGDNLGAAVALAPLGEAEYLQRNFSEAAGVIEESLALVREIGNFFIAGRRLTRLGQIAFAQNDLEKAAALAKEGLATCADSGDKSGATMALAVLAEIARDQGELKRAARILGSVEGLREVYGAAMWFVDRLEYDRQVEALHAQLEDTPRTAAWSEGRTMNFEQAVDYSLSGLEFSPIKKNQKEKFGGLTLREREVVALIAQGKSNREIAEELVITVRTAETYVSRILNKLGFDSRVRIATWAVEKGLSPPASP